MKFCPNCGTELADSMKFCPECGTPILNAENPNRNLFDGDIHKCPNCGEILGAFVSVCPSCGYELRNAKTANSIKSFSIKIGQSETVEQKVTLIRNYPVPNTKEDILEFMILASSSISGENDENLFNAWLAKFEQCYQKANLTFKSDAKFIKIQELYDRTVKQISKEKKAHSANKIGLAISKFTATFPNPVFAIVLVLLIIFAIIRIIRGDFAGIDILFDAIILGVTYKITIPNNKKK